MINVALAREIYGLQPWMVDGLTFSSLINVLNDLRNGGNVISSTEKLNNHFFYEIKSATRLVSRPAQVDQSSGDEYISVINLNGVITKEGGDSTYGTKQLSRMLLQFDADPKVIGHIILADSGGGSSAGMKVMRRAIEQVQKPIASLIEYGGIAASAAYGIIAATDRIFAESGTDQVGSIGTMISAKATPDKAVDKDGAKQITIYATASVNKNKWIQEALENDDYTLAISEILDPANEEFMQNMRNDRPSILESQLDGSVFNVGDVIGSLVDEIGNFASAVNFIKNQSKSITFNNQNKLAMTTAQELKAAHPEIYNEIFNLGVTSGQTTERDRVGSWMAHAGTDLEAVKTGITSGESISQTARENFLVKAHSKPALEALKTDSAAPVIVPEAQNNAQATTEEEKELNSMYGKYSKKEA